MAYKSSRLNRPEVQRTHTRAFIRQFLRSPLQTGAVVPSSKFLTESMFLGIDAKKISHYAEYGPGSGRFTVKAQDFLTHIESMILFEINPVFTAMLQQQFSTAKIYRGPDELVGTIGQKCDETIDLIISGLPFTNIPLPISKKTVTDAHRLLRPGGSFRTFLYAHTFYLPKNVELRDYLGQIFSDVQYRFVGRNIPPAVVIEANK